MQILLPLLFLFGIVRSAYITFLADDSEFVMETDVMETLSHSTFIAGEPFLHVSTIKTRESANTKGSLSFSPRTDTSFSSQTAVVGMPQSAPTITVESVSHSSKDHVSYLKNVGTSLSSVSDAESRITSTKNGEHSISLESVANLRSSYETLERVSSSTHKTTTLTPNTRTTTTSTLFSSSSSVSGTQLTGTILTSVSSGTAIPLVTQEPSYSSQATTILPSSLAANKTISTSSFTPIPEYSGLSSSLYYNNTVSVVTSTSGTENSSVQTMNSTKQTQSGYYPSSVTLSSSTSSWGSTYITTPASSVPESSLYESALTRDTISSISSSIEKTSSLTVPTTTIVNLFNAVETNEPPAVFARAPNPTSLASGVSNDGPIQTNKFYTNLIVGDQQSAAFVYPYSLWKYSSSDNYGFAVQHTTSDQYSYGNYDSSGNSEYLVNPLGVAHVIFSATVFDSGMTMEVDDMTISSTRVVLSESEDKTNYLEIPLVQGMGFATGIYHGSLYPRIASSVGFESLLLETSDSLAEGILKYRITLLNGVTWLCYIIGPNELSVSDFSLKVTSTYEIEAETCIDGLIIQMAVAPSDSSYDISYDQAAGMYVTDFTLRGLSDTSSANYEFLYTTKGMSASGRTMIFALPHHQYSFSDAMQNSFTGIQLQSTTKGTMTGYLTTSLQFDTSLNKQISWLPWSSQLGESPLTYSVEQLKLLAEVANTELQVSISSSISGLNTYYIGKVIDKYAYILLTVSQIIQDEAVTKSTLDNLKSAFDILLQNSQTYPLIYDTKFNGLVSSGDWASTATQYDFGNTYYNDHHFHYGYIIHAAAVVGYVDAQLGGSWAADNKDWVNTLIRDVANPSTDDQYFAQSRMFDWYHGHSWAAGLFENGNGKNEESSSEDYNFAYGMKLWGVAIGDLSMELRADLMISIMKDSMSCYFYYEDDNDVEPSEITGNKVSGIIFDNIIDYTTYFGTEIEYIHGIHMLPTTPVSSNMRSESFVQQEWDSKISSFVDSLESPWTGILRLNQALFNPAESYAFFNDSNFDSNTYLDNGMSRTWALAFSGGLANSLGLL